ncbi:FixH family protein [Engelhardtia mirabilis]|uniref:YtkA-like domain-containing protein n=1 Tax=Engelhardtia mirabilis TaxID=2528011 RepID=A0A518BHS2_9BACT|nr:hypothetical protein Pla133_15970 [Planctomycetes bacterium Pla133]QDV00847.1 hypothetical protein Pla86_15960 [Planctomycetes bacterium Pla86]
MANQFGDEQASGPVRKAPSWASRSGTAGVLLLVVLATGACGRDDAGDHEIDVALSFDPAASTGPTTCVVELSGPDGQPVAGAVVHVEGNMSHAGMVPVFGDAVEASAGRYEAPFEFTMGGDWFVVVSADLADGRQLERVIDVPAVSVRRPGTTTDSEQR